MASKNLGFRSLGAVLAVWFLILASATAQSGNDIIYVYDELGRLVAVINPAGETATYHYDSVGNILSIQRYNSSVVSVIEFTPNSGPAGTTVTIYGTGFSTTPSQNTVSFNGVAASVTSSTFSQIVATVPATATTGPISVTTPTGSAVSAGSFVVGDSAPPTITGFTPTIGTIGTAVTITGTNFETTASRNRVKFNATVAASGTATATTIDTHVPAATTSGRIKIETTGGSATSSTDFFIPPSPYTAADVLVTDRMTLGDTRTVSISTANKIGLILFDAVEGQRASVKINSTNFNPSLITIYGPKGAVLTSGFFSPSNGSHWETPLLPITGTHTIMIDPSTTQTGNVNFTLYNASDQTGTINIGDPTTAFTIPTPGQNLVLKFNGTAGQRVSVGMSDVTIPGIIGFCATVSITTIGGSVILAPTNFNVDTGGTPTVTLPGTGVYKLIVDPKSGNTGNVSLTLSEELTGTMTIGGSAQTFTFRRGQNGKFSFSGTAGQRVSVGLSSVTVGAGQCCDVGSVAINKPDNTSLLAPVAFRTSGQGTTSVVLPTSGTYSILVDPFLAHHGNVTLTLSEDHSGTIVINGPTVPLTFAAGQNALLTFSGTAGQRVSLGISSVTIGTGSLDVGNVSISNPDGSTLLAPLGFRLEGQGTPSVILPVTGTYSILINPLLSNSGNATFTLSEDLAPSISINGSDVPLSFSRAGQNSYLTFSGVAGQRVTVGISSVTIGAGDCCTVGDISIFKPDGTTQLAPFAFSTSGNGTLTQVLPVTGTYSIIVNPHLARTGNGTVTLAEDLSGSVTINGASVPLTFRPGQNGLLTFTGSAGQRVSVGMTNVTVGAGSCCTVASVGINNPDGSTLLSPVSFSTSGTGTNTVVLPVAGTYSIVINPFLATSGDLTLTLSADLTDPITINGTPLALTFRPGQNGLLTFSGVAGQRVSLGMSGVTIGAGTSGVVANVAINKPDGTVLLSAVSFGTNGSTSVTVVLPVTGTYTIPVNPLAAHSGDMILTLSEDVSGTVTINGGTLPLSLSRVGQNAYITFSGTSGNVVTVRLTGNTIGNTTVKLLNPDGTTLTSSSSGSTSFNLTQKTLPTTGTYVITIDPNALATGNITVEVTNP